MPNDSEQTAEPSVEQLRDRVENPVWRLLSDYCRPHFHYIGFSICTMLIAQVFWLFPPLVLGVAFDAIFLGDQPYHLPIIPNRWLPTTTMGQFWTSLGLFALSFFGASSVYLVGSWARSIAAYRIQHDLRTDAYATIQHLQFGSFENQPYGLLGVGNL
jgi:ATP-binding cassette subfamily B protein